MKFKLFSLCTLVFFSISSLVFAEKSNQDQKQDTTEINTPHNETIQKNIQYVVYYLHMNRRCMTCKKLETYADEAIKTAFEKELTDSTIVWKSLNFEEKEYEHFAEEYKLYSQSLVISKLHNGKESEWKNLDKIWTLVNDKDAYITYVQKSITDFMKDESDK